MLSVGEASLVPVAPTSTIWSFPVFVPTAISTFPRHGTARDNCERLILRSTLATINRCARDTPVRCHSLGSEGSFACTRYSCDPISGCLHPRQNRSSCGNSFHVSRYAGGLVLSSHPGRGEDEQEQFSTPRATIFELLCENNTDMLTPNGNLHNSTLDLLRGERATATMTDLGFLVVNHPKGTEDRRGDTHYLQLGIGNHCWSTDFAIPPDSTGMGANNEALDQTSEGRTSQQMEGTKANANVTTVNEAIKSTVSVTSVTELYPATSPSAKLPRVNGVSLPSPSKLRRIVRRAIARARASRALRKIRLKLQPRSSGNRNPLLRAGVGQLLPAEYCQKIVSEAEASNSWEPWDGDLGHESSAIRLDHLRDSCAEWQKTTEEVIRARIAQTYGVRADSVALAPQHVFVCRGPLPSTRGTIGDLRRKRRPEGDTTDPPRFKRSTSLITFAIALPALKPQWLVWLEQRKACLHPTHQGGGVIWSGKARHAIVGIAPSSGGHGNLDVPVILRGFADIGSPHVHEDVKTWQWGYPAWHVNAHWVKDEDILDRAWVDPGLTALAERTDQNDDLSRGKETRRHTRNIPSKEINGTANRTRMQLLQPKNTTLAHRYYKQGAAAGMDLPVVDSDARPVIDIVSTKPSWFLRPEQHEVTLYAILRRRLPGLPWKIVGRAAFSTGAGASASMDEALGELFGDRVAAPGGEPIPGVLVPPIKYVFVDPRFRGLGLGRRLFLEAMCLLAQRGFRYALIIVEDNGTGGLFGFYEEMGFVRAEEQLRIPRVMIAPIPPSPEILAR